MAPSGMRITKLSKPTYHSGYSGLYLKDGTLLSAQDRIVLAVLKELQTQGYDFELKNVDGTACIMLVDRYWK